MLPLKDDQPRYSTPYVNTFLIGLNILIYLLQFLQQVTDPRGAELVARQFGEVPAHLAAFLAGSPRYSLEQVVLPFFTSMFLHAGWTHVLGNMWFLYIFGDNIEDYLGHFTYLLFYLLCGLFAMATQVAMYPHSTIPTVGASGAIAGVLGEWFVLNFLSGAQTLSMAHAGGDMGGVAFWAHVGGFVSGLVMVKLFPERRRRTPYAYRYG